MRSDEPSANVFAAPTFRPGSSVAPNLAFFALSVLICGAACNEDSGGGTGLLRSSLVRLPDFKRTKRSTKGPAARWPATRPI